MLALARSRLARNPEKVRSRIWRRAWASTFRLRSRGVFALVIFCRQGPTQGKGPRLVGVCATWRTCSCEALGRFLCRSPVDVKQNSTRAQWTSMTTRPSATSREKVRAPDIRSITTEKPATSIMDVKENSFEGDDYGESCAFSGKCKERSYLYTTTARMRGFSIRSDSFLGSGVRSSIGIHGRKAASAE